MHNDVKRVLVYLLLLLMPLQAPAAVAVLACYAEMNQAAAVEHVMEDCHSAFMIQDFKSDAGKPDAERHAGSSPPSPSSSSSPCGMSSSCLALASIALLPSDRVLLADRAIQQIVMHDEFYTSYIPEGLQRPPKPTLA